MDEKAQPAGPFDRSVGRTVTVRKIGVFSVAKVFGLVYAGVGLLIGTIFSVFSLAGGLIGSLAQGDGSAIIGLIFGIGSIVFFPIFYGLLGFLGISP